MALPSVLRHIVSHRAFSVIAPAVFVGLLTAYAVSNANVAPDRSPRILPGKPLAAYTEFYPIQYDANGRLFLDRDRFVKAVSYLTEHPSHKAIFELIYLGQANNVSLQLNDDEKAAYKVLLDHPDYRLAREFNSQRDSVFERYKYIVKGFGQTFAGTGIEVVLHDIRNPLASVVEIQNPISGRRLRDPTTNFGVELIKSYSVLNTRGENFISYPLKLKDGRAVKSSTIPLFDETYGLIGFICINIDISKLDVQNNRRAVEAFVDHFTETVANDKITEVIENSKRNRKL